MSYDIISGILIIRMILGHYVSYAGLKDSLLFESFNILYFYMPWFFYKSGMYAKQIKKKSRLEYVYKEFRHLIIPFLSFTVVGFICSISFDAITNPAIIWRNVLKQIAAFVELGYFYWSSHLWFLIALFMTKYIYNVYAYKWRKSAVLGITLVLSTLHHVYISPKGIVWGGYLCSGLFFFSVGSIMKELQYKRIYLYGSLALTFLIAIVCPTFVSMFGNTLQNDGIYLLWYPFSIGGIVIINNLFQKVSDTSILMRIFSLIGRNSILFYLSHFSIAILVCKLYHFYQPDGNNWEFLCILLIVSSIALPLLSDILNLEKLKWVIGK